MRDLVRQADRHKHMGRVERAGRAGRAGRATHARKVKAQDQALALDRLEHERRRARQATHRVAGVMGVRDVVHDALDELVRQLFDVAHLLFHALDGFLHRRRQADAACGVLGARAQAALLAAAVYQRLERDALLDVQHAHAARAAELVRGQGQHVNAHLLHVDRHVADRLHCVRVELRADRMRQLGNLPDRLDGADLIVRRHDGDERGVLGEFALELLEIHMAFLIHVQIGDAVALFFERLAGVQHRVVLDPGGNEVLAALGRRAVHKAADGEVVRLRAAAGEDDLARCVVVGFVYRHRGI